MHYRLITVYRIWTKVTIATPTTPKKGASGAATFGKPIIPHGCAWTDEAIVRKTPKHVLG